MFIVEVILHIVSVESVIFVQAADYGPRPELPGKQFLVIAIQVACRDSVGLAYNSLAWVLRQSKLEGFSVGQEDRWD